MIKYIIAAAAVVTIALILVIYLLFRKNRQTAAEPAPSAFPPPGVPAQRKLVMQQIGPDGSTVQSFVIKEPIPPEGISISRPGASKGDILLSSAAGMDAMTIGTENIVIAKDEQGFFGQLCENEKKKNQLFLFDPETQKSIPTDQFEIHDGTLVCMGKQWLKFIFTD